MEKEEKEHAIGARECLTMGLGVRAAAWKSQDDTLLRKGFLEISLCVVQLNPCLPTASSLYPLHPLLRRYPCLKGVFRISWPRKTLKCGLGPATMITSSGYS